MIVSRTSQGHQGMVGRGAYRERKSQTGNTGASRVILVLNVRVGVPLLVIKLPKKAFTFLMMLLTLSSCRVPN